MHVPGRSVPNRRNEIQTVENQKERPTFKRNDIDTVPAFSSTGYGSQHLSTMWFQPKGANNQQRNAERDNLGDHPSPSVEQAAPPPSSDAMEPAKSAHAGGSLTSTTRSGRGHRKTTNDKKSVPVSSGAGDGPNLSTIMEEADESMCSDLTSER